MRAEQTGKDVFLVMLWTDGPLNVRQMFPTEGDAPGLDFADLPRPPKSRRILSAWEEGQGPALNMYLSEHQNGKALEEHYRAELPKFGWKATTPAANAPEHAARGVLMMRGGVSAVVAAATDAQGRGIASLLPMDVQGAARVDVR
jgi:hypothetical protein